MFNIFSFVYLSFSLLLNQYTCYSLSLPLFKLPLISTLIYVFVLSEDLCIEINIHLLDYLWIRSIWICTSTLNSICSKQRISSVQFSCSVVSDSLRPHESQHTRPPCPSPTPGVHSNSCPSSQWCHQDISSSVIPFSPCPQSLPASGSFQISQLFTWGGQTIGVSASA